MPGRRPRFRRSRRFPGNWTGSCSRARRRGPGGGTGVCAPGKRASGALDAEADPREDPGASDLDRLAALVRGRRAQVLVLEVKADVAAEADIGARQSLEGEAARRSLQIAAE